MRGAAWQKYATARPIATQVPGHRCMDNLTTERSFDSQAIWVIRVLGLFFRNDIHVVWQLM